MNNFQEIPIGALFSSFKSLHSAMYKYENRTKLKLIVKNSTTCINSITLPKQISISPAKKN